MTTKLDVYTPRAMLLFCGALLLATAFDLSFNHLVKFSPYSLVLTCCFLFGGACLTWMSLGDANLKNFPRWLTAAIFIAPLAAIKCARSSELWGKEIPSSLSFQSPLLTYLEFFSAPANLIAWEAQLHLAFSIMFMALLFLRLDPAKATVASAASVFALQFPAPISHELAAAAYPLIGTEELFLACLFLLLSPTSKWVTWVFVFLLGTAVTGLKGVFFFAFLFARLSDIEFSRSARVGLALFFASPFLLSWKLFEACCSVAALSTLPNVFTLAETLGFSLGTIHLFPLVATSAALLCSGTKLFPRANWVSLELFVLFFLAGGDLTQAAAASILVFPLELLSQEQKRGRVSSSLATLLALGVVSTLLSDSLPSRIQDFKPEIRRIMISENGISSIELYDPSLLPGAPLEIRPSSIQSSRAELNGKRIEINPPLPEQSVFDRHALFSFQNAGALSRATYHFPSFLKTNADIPNSDFAYWERGQIFIRPKGWFPRLNQGVSQGRIELLREQGERAIRLSYEPLFELSEATPYFSLFSFVELAGSTLSFRLKDPRSPKERQNSLFAIHIVHGESRVFFTVNASLKLADSHQLGRANVIPLRVPENSWEDFHFDWDTIAKENQLSQPPTALSKFRPLNFPVRESYLFLYLTTNQDSRAVSPLIARIASSRRRELSLESRKTQWLEAQEGLVDTR